MSKCPNNPGVPAEFCTCIVCKPPVQASPPATASNAKPDDEILADVAKRWKVQRICTAYESGVGRGESGRDKSQPYDATCDEGIAYELGWYRGRSNFARAQERAAALDERRSDDPFIRDGAL